MLAKILGGGILLGAGGIMAYYGVRSEKRRLDVLDAWIDLISEIRTQIAMYLRPIDDILLTVDKALKKRLGAPSATTLTELLETSLPVLDRNAIRPLNALVQGMGSCYREEQVERCNFCLAALQRVREKQAHELPNRQKLVLTISISLPLGISVLLW